MDVLKRNNVKVLGSGDQAILFLHGYGCDQNMWRLITPSFIEKHTVILMDLVGCGNSDENAFSKEKYNDLDGYVNDLIEVCEALNLPKISLVGHSISANICLKATVENPNLFDKLILVCPSPKFINDGDYVGGFSVSDIEELIDSLETNYLGWSKAMAPVIMGNPESPELAEELEESFCSNNAEIAIQFAKVTFLCDNRKDLEKVKIPTLIIQSKEDNLASVGVGKYVQNKIKGSELEIIDSTGHCPHLSHPTQTVAAINSFL